MKNIIGSIFIILFLIYTNISRANDYTFELISPDAGFSYNQVSTITLDHNGMVWFGCSNILYTYNSDKISVINTTINDSVNSIMGNINHLYFDHSKLLWICASNGLYTFDRKTNIFKKAKINNPQFQNDLPVYSINQINDSIYWCKAGNFLYKYNINTHNFMRLKFKNSELSNASRLAVKDKNNTFWIGMSNGIVYRYDQSTDRIILFHHKLNSPVTSICVGDIHVWIGYEGGGLDKVRIDKAWSLNYNENNNNKSIKLLSNNVRKIIERANGDIWVGTNEGINIITDTSNTTIVSDELNKLPYNSIFEMVQDNYKGIWIGTWAGGLAYYNSSDYRFKHIKKFPSIIETPKNNIASFVQDSNGILWIATENAGLKSYNLKLNTYNSFNPVNEKNAPLRIKSLATDDQQLYIGTVSQGLWQGNLKTQKYTKIELPILEKRILQKILIDKNNVWIAVYGKGVLNYNSKTGQIKVYNNENTNGAIQSDWIRTLFIDSFNNLWVGSNHGMSVKLNGSDNFKKMSINQKQLNIHINSIFEVEPGKIWVATKSNQVFEIEKDKLNLKLISKEWPEGISEIFSIQSDELTNIWLSTRQGIIMYSPSTLSFTHFSPDDASSISSFNPNASLKLSNGNIVFGSTNGYLIVNPNGVVNNPHVPNVYLSEFNINNKSFEKSDIKKINTLFLSDLENIELYHTENNFTFSFVTNNYVKPAQNKYRCRLLNYQDEWVDLGTKNEVSFTKIPPGKYELQVLGSNNNNVWSTTPFTLEIYIAPPYWKTTTAFIIYITILIIISYFTFRELKYRTNLKRNILIERVRHESEEELFAEKQKFFTNISHELRTPLTLIISPLNILAESLQYEHHLKEHVLIAQRNADRLLRLTNEILDMRSIENGSIKLNVKKVNIVQICQQVYNCFTHEAMEKKINYTFSSKFEEFLIDADSNKIEKVIFNLLSNAFKFTPEGNQIILSIDFTMLNDTNYKETFFVGKKYLGECLEIKVKNFGEGISQKDILHIFDRFSTSSNISITGTGLGLHIAKEYIALHNGNILVSSELNNDTEFIINIPTKLNTIVKPKNILLQINIDNQNPIENDDKSKPDIYKASEKVILIVEDNSDLRKYLQKELIKYYKVITAVNGKQGYEIALEVTPDIIISDIMMPVMDGNELTKKIKTTPDTDDIPVILLTALAEKSSKIEGITQGADAYLIKPVEMDLLMAQIKNLLEARDKISRKLIEKLIKIETGEIIKPIGFIEELEIFIVKNLLNTNFGLNDILEKFNMSRSTFYRKLKKDYNQTFTEFINDVRLKRALELIKTGDNSLDEVAFQVGFNSYSYFSRVFKQKYGKSPKQFSREL